MNAAELPATVCIVGELCADSSVTRAFTWWFHHIRFFYDMQVPAAEMTRKNKFLR